MSEENVEVVSDCAKPPTGLARAAGRSEICARGLRGPSSAVKIRANRVSNSGAR
jgi:hypothetical protein